MAAISLQNAVIILVAVFAIISTVYALYRMVICYYFFQLRRDRVSHRTNTVWRTVSNDFGDEQHGRYIHVREYRRAPREAPAAPAAAEQ
uniref:Secreted protein n=1 Tax=Caenorhabditis tropicalis TaxID=1561998 RepID=A0A1I7TBQ6_9PELO